VERRREVIEEGLWNPTMPLIALARQVERSNRWGEKVPSEDSVTRALDQIYEETRDRRFQRAAKAARGEFLETLPMVLAQPLHFFDELASTDFKLAPRLPRSRLGAPRPTTPSVVKSDPTCSSACALRLQVKADRSSPNIIRP
jgi:hypothetical protein